MNAGKAVAGHEGSFEDLVYSLASDAKYTGVPTAIVKPFRDIVVGKGSTDVRNFVSDYIFRFEPDSNTMNFLFGEEE